MVRSVLKLFVANLTLILLGFQHMGSTTKVILKGIKSPAMETWEAFITSTQKAGCDVIFKSDVGFKAFIEMQKSSYDLMITGPFFAVLSEVERKQAYWGGVITAIEEMGDAGQVAQLRKYLKEVEKIEVAV